MATRKQTSAAKANIKKAQRKWKSMTKRQHSLAQPQGRGRQKPGTTGKGRFYRIQVRPKGEFVTFRVQDVGMKGGVERLAGKRTNGSWDTVSWLIEKKDAHITANGRLHIDNKKAQSVLEQIRGPIMHVKGDIFKARIGRNVPEREKPTAAMKRAQRTNIKKAQAARKKRR